MSSMVLCLFVLCVLLCLATAPLAAAGANLLKNGDFAVDSDGDGLADEWAFSGNAVAVTATEKREPLPQGGFAQGLICTHFVAGGADHHAMLAQYDTFALKKDHWYRLSFRAKGNLGSTAAYAAIQQTAPTWETAGLNSPFRVHGEWRDISFTFRAARDVGPNVRLQIWFEETGELWLREVQLVEVESGETKAVEAYTDVLADLGGKNLLPNGSFECGASGWGTMGEGVGWAGSGFNTLFGHVDKGTAPSPHGSSFRLDLDQATAPIASFDYLDVVEKKQLLPLLSNRGWIRVTPGEAYTLSASVKADPAGTPALMRVYVAFRGWEDKAVTATGEWQRVSFTFRPSGDQIYVGIGPDLRESSLPRTTMWIGDVQLEKGEQATDYAPRAPIEIGLEWPHPGHLFFAPGEAQAFVTAFTAGPARTVRVQAEVTDFFDRVVDRPTLELALQPGKAVRTPLPMHLHENGFYRLRLTAAEGAVIPTLAERFGVVAKPRDPNGLFGMNHAYSTNDLLRISRDFGLTWYRDWSLKWHQVEPEKGHFDFSKLEYHIDRVRKEGLNVLGLLPFPSSNWSGSAPTGEPNTDMGEHARLAVRPTNLDDFATYVRTTVQHYQGRIRVWEVLNEPIYTGYALPKRSGYTTRDYVEMLAVAYREIKSVDPKAIVIGGIAGNPETETDELIAAGGLDHLDAINLHIYPVFRLPETYDEPLRKLREKLGATGKPIYYTEGGYYGDDDLPTAPFAAGDSLMAPLESERECSAYQTRLNLILLAHGTRMVIVHAGTSGTLNDPSVGGIYFEWDGAPRKMAITLSVMNALFGADVLPAGTVWENVRSPIFHSRGKTVVALWDEHRRHVTLTPRPGAQVLDIAGARVQGKTFEIDDCPHYVVLEGTRTEGEVRATLGAWR